MKKKNFLSMTQELDEFIITYEPSSRIRSHILDERIFQIVYKPEIAYWLGFLMADSSIKDYSLRLNLSEKDLGHLIKFRKFLRTDYPIKKYMVNKRCYYRFGIYSKKLIKDLEQYGIIARKCGKEQIKNIPVEYIRDFILGYFDGDGCICRDKRGCLGFSIASSSFELLERIQEVLMIKCDLSKTKIQKNKRTYILVYGGNNQIQRIYEFLYEEGINSIDYLERKKDKFLD